MSAAAQDPADSEQRRHLILVVEDNKADVYLIRAGIAAAQVDADLQVITNGEAAIRFLDDADRDDRIPRPVLVILDLNLPRRSGAEVLKHLRQSRRNADASVLIVTSSDSSRDRAETALLGANEYFRKPSEYNAYLQLGTFVKRLVGQSERGASAQVPGNSE